MIKHLLQALGLRTDCCNAKIITWHQNKYYCAQCRRWLNEPLNQTSAAQTSKPVTKTQLV